MGVLEAGRPHATANPPPMNAPEVRPVEGSEKERQVLHKGLVLVAAAAVGLWDVGAHRQQHRQLRHEELVQVGKVSVVLGAHLQRGNLLAGAEGG